MQRLEKNSAFDGLLFIPSTGSLKSECLLSETVMVIKKGNMMWHLLWKAQSRFCANVATCIWTKDTGNKIFDIKLNHNKVRNDDVLDLCWRKLLNLSEFSIFSVSEAAILPVKSWIYNVEFEVLGPIFKDRFRFTRRLPMVTYCRSLVQSVSCWQSYMACFARHYWTFYYDSGYQKWHLHSVWIRPMILVYPSDDVFH